MSEAHEQIQRKTPEQEMLVELNTAISTYNQARSHLGAVMLDAVELLHDKQQLTQPSTDTESADSALHKLIDEVDHNITEEVFERFFTQRSD